MLQQPLPEEYERLEETELFSRIRAAKERLGPDLLILGHHYQRDEIIQFADETGDSFKLARRAAQTPSAKFIVFCGVHFMAESADILTSPEQVVVLPNLTAGCSMADMANMPDVQVCWQQLSMLGNGQTLPITYINSAACLKSFTGENGGTVCTSSNAPAALRWGWESAPRLLFFPDEHLGRNTAIRMGIGEEQIAVWDRFKPLGGNPPDALRRARIVLWNGYCSVHMRFTVQQIERARREHPGVRVIVHPECRREVCDAADAIGSTEKIARAVAESEPGSIWAVGTEINLVHRLAQKHPDKTVFCLNETVCVCSTMYRIHPKYLCWALENLAAGRIVNQVKVDDETAAGARLALDRMLSLS
jgi:quinolinate synthase